MSDQHFEGDMAKVIRDQVGRHGIVGAGAVAAGAAVVVSFWLRTAASGPAAVSPADVSGSPTATASPRTATASVSPTPTGGVLQIHTELPLPSDEPPACLTASLGGPQRLTVSGPDLVLVDVNTGRQTTIVWPYGFVARLVDGKAELEAPDGSVVAHEGDLLNVGGGFALPGFHVCEINGTTYVNGQSW
jgi:hypothetical protein